MKTADRRAVVRAAAEGEASLCEAALRRRPDGKAKEFNG